MEPTPLPYKISVVIQYPSGRREVITENLISIQSAVGIRDHWRFQSKLRKVRIIQLDCYDMRGNIWRKMNIEDLENDG